MKIRYIIISSVLFLAMTFNTTSYAYTTDNTEISNENNTENEENIEDPMLEVIDILDNSELNDDDPLNQELKELSDALKKTISIMDEQPNLEEFDPLYSYSLGENKVVDIFQVENDTYIIWYTLNKAYKLSGEPLLNFFYTSIYRATGLNLQ